MKLAFFILILNSTYDAYHKNKKTLVLGTDCIPYLNEHLNISWRSN